MAPLKFFFFFLVFLPLFLFQPMFTVDDFCPAVFCDDILVSFPFRLSYQPYCCGDPNFNLACRSTDQTIINFPFSGEFTVDVISYSPRYLQLSQYCIPERLLQGLDLSATPFKPLYPESYTFLNCSSETNVSMVYPAIKFICLSDLNFSIWGIPTIAYNQSSSLSSCLEIAKILVPLPSPNWPTYGFDDIVLTWEQPDCKSAPCNYCGSSESNCQNGNGDGVDGECSNLHEKKNGLSTSTKYALIFIVTPIILILVLIIICNVRVHCYDGRRGLHHRPNAEISSFIAEPPVAPNPITVNGLDGSSIEAYPITLLDENFKLPRPNDNTCSICLSEYEAKETIRTIPDCTHYFHANCIDEWLKLNAACPVCRNTPDHDPASLITRSTSSSPSRPPQ
ncbi:hypothetical protein Goshw_011799 [Gossypium schwendimanii]|uniref:RING-type E3 ubiquitin transferase n=1 Tax=Gossypium schwendimanii TaxID=34291 RepID=A0A7J9KX01_GOSSC|nr:hypothetical protein [Gossypium schwendimanii]